MYVYIYIYIYIYGAASPSPPPPSPPPWLPPLTGPIMLPSPPPPALWLGWSGWCGCLRGLFNPRSSPCGVVVGFGFNPPPPLPPVMRCGAVVGCGFQV